ncbi:MAG: hypothetical protein FDZ75_08605 [Actinobacteria bacterium]|nr:MAG: hypothetical protein FDZ75_08605 [Actinomycetota bacterium]
MTATATPVQSTLLTETRVSEATTVYVYITKTGHKYHRSTCRYLRYSKIRVTLRDAKRRGYTACLVCRPPR